jgi:F-type H+-transporting ATPase subunit b
MNINFTLIAQAIAFAVLIWFTVKFVWPPLLKAIEARQKEIADGLAAAADGRNALEVAAKKSEVTLTEAKQKASEIIAQAEKRGTQIIEEAKGNAKVEGDRIIAGAKAEIDQEVNRAKEGLRAQVSSLAVAGAEKILNLFPPDTHQPRLSSSVIEAILAVTSVTRDLSEEDILHNLQKTEIRPQMLLRNDPHTHNDRFAFIIHPLSKTQIAQIPGFDFLKKSPLLDFAETVASKVPGYHYCKITGIRSEHNGKEISGDLYLLPSTPKMLLKQPAEKVYDSLTNICEMAYKRGA